MIITGSQDCLIRIWEPFVPKKPSNFLRGHITSVIDLVVDEKDDNLISIDKSQSNIVYLKILYKIYSIIYNLRCFYMVFNDIENFTKSFFNKSTTT